MTQKQPPAPPPAPPKDPGKTTEAPDAGKAPGAGTGTPLPHKLPPSTGEAGAKKG